MTVSLLPFTADRLPEVQRWLHHPEVDRRLGGPEWPARGLAMAGTGIGEFFRGRRVLRVHSWVAFDDAGIAAMSHPGPVCCPCGRSVVRPRCRRGLRGRVRAAARLPGAADRGRRHRARSQRRRE